jgi:MSHA biogenesis protein MshG
VPLSYNYTGRTPAGAKISGELKADSQRQALDVLEKKHVIVTSLKQDGDDSPIKSLRFFKPDYSQQLIMFARHLATYHRSGIPLLKALSLIKVDKPGSPFQVILREVAQKVSEGKQLSGAMRDYPDAFWEVFVNAVEAGEASGHLASILDDSATTMERELELRRQIKSSLRYPLIVIIAIALAIGVLITFVIPKFATFYGKFNSELPAPTRALIWISEMTQTYWYYCLAGLGAFTYLVRKFHQSTKGRQIWDRITLKLPVFGDLIIKAAVARFTLLLMILFKAGIPIVRSLSILEDSQKNVHLRNEINSMRLSFESGKELDVSEGPNRYFPEMALNMIKSGLESGSLETMLAEIGNHYSREVERTSKNLASLIEPMLTVVVGGIVLLLALSIFLPMWNLIKVFH